MTTHPLAGSRVLVLGASGFIGSRLVERLAVECGSTVRVMVRRVMSAATLARFPIELAIGDVTNMRDVATAADGCRVVFNCVKGTGKDAAMRRAADVDGARHAVEAAAVAGARVVHLSTMAVYDRPSDGTFDETSADAPAGDPYTDNKLAGERIVLQTGAQLGVPVTVLQPTVVYGPHSAVYGSEILDEMRSYRLILVNGGDGICNAVYVDDVVTAILLAATATIGGERFLVSGPEPVTWRAFFSNFERLLGGERTVSLSTEEALGVWRESRRRRWLWQESLQILRENVPVRRRLLSTREGAAVRELARHVMPDGVRQKLRDGSASASGVLNAQLPIGPVRPWVVHNLARKARARIDKARTVLGYEPVLSLDDGMRLTAEWARWAGVAPASPP